MSGSGNSVSRLLERHKSRISREECFVDVVRILVSRGIFSYSEQGHILAELDYDLRGEIFARIFSRKGFNAFRELCALLETRCPHLLTSLLLDTTDSVSESNYRSYHSRESSIISLSQKYRDMDLNVPPPPPSNHSTRSSSSTPYGFLPPPPIISSDDVFETGVVREKSYGAGEELLEEPVEEQGGERIVWEYHQVILSRVPGYGFGIAVSGGRDNPHFTNGDASIAISDVLKAGPAEGKLLINDRVISANNISLENVDYATAVQVLRDSGQNVHLVVKRRVVLPPTAAPPEPQSLRLSLCRKGKKEDFGVVLGCKIYVKEILPGSSADKDGSLREGDFLHKVNSTSVDGLSLKEARKLIESAKDKLDLVIKRDPFSSSHKKGISGNNLSNGHGLKGGDAYNSTSYNNNQYPENEAPKNNYAAQNLYVQPPSRPSAYQPDEKNNLIRAGQDGANGIENNPNSGPPRPPLPTTDEDSTDEASSSPIIPSPFNDGAETVTTSYYRQRYNRSQIPEYGTSSHRRTEDDRSVPERSNNTNLPDPRFISFQKAGSVGIRLTGGNDVGIFVTAVQPGSPASQRGLQPGDKILKVNDMDMKGVTREEAVLFLLSLQDTINLIAQYRRDEYDQIVSLQRGDSFYIKAHFNYEIPEKSEMSFRKSDVFHVVDTLHNGVVGAWQVFRMDPFLSGLGRSSSSEQVQKGVIPNKARAEEIATQQFNAAKKEQNQSEQSKGGSFFRRKREKSHRRSKSLGKRIKDSIQFGDSPTSTPKSFDRRRREFSVDRILRKSRKCQSEFVNQDHWEDLVWSESMSKFPAYERVSLRHPGFPRPVVIFGPVADLARERLLRDYPVKFASPQESSDDLSKNKSGIVRLSSIREIMDRRKHALLDVTPSAVDKLNYAQFYPIVIFVRADSKQTIKDCRAGVPKKAHLSSKKLFEQCQKLEKLWGHVFTGTLNLSNDNWYTKLTDLIDKQQTAPIWMSESKPDESFSDDFLFPMTSRLSYTSSPESDGEFCGEPETPKPTRAIPDDVRPQQEDEEGRLARSNSESNLANKNEVDSGSGKVIPNYNAPVSCSVEAQNNSNIKKNESHHPPSSKRDVYGFRRTHLNESIDDLPLPPHPNHSSSSTSSSSPQNSANNSNGNHRISPGKADVIGGPELPPKIERHKKPSRRSTDESSSLDRNMHIRDMKMSAYDQNGGSIYDTYKSLDTEVPNTRANSLHHHPDSNRQHRAASQDPSATYRRPYSNGYDAGPKYNGTGSTTNHSNKTNGYESKYRYADYKPVPPPKTASYKPIPPPKPKSYPRTQSQPPSMEGNYMNSGPYSGQYNRQSTTNYDDGDSNAGFDSGQGSSLDRDYYGNGTTHNGMNRQQYYYNVPGNNTNGTSNLNAGSSPKRNGGDGLDLSNREYRGSAFELYKKPLSSCPPPTTQPNYFNGHTIGR